MAQQQTCLAMILFWGSVIGVLQSVQGRWNPRAVDLRTVTSEEVQPMLELMRDYGAAELDKAKKQGLADGTAKQYLVVVAASEDELKSAASRDYLPYLFTAKDGNTGGMRRAAFILNDKNNSCEYYQAPKALHGEVIAIDFGITDRLLQNFHQDFARNPKYPFLLLYTYYIPCTDVRCYDCAEEVMNYARGKQSEFAVIVGYWKIFWRTNEAKSLSTMREGGILSFQRTDNGQYQQTVEYNPPRDVDNHVGTFQRHFYDCLLNESVAACCDGGPENQKKLVSFFTNDVTYNCTSQSRRRRLITKGGEHELRTCIAKAIDYHANNNCDACSKIESSTHEPKLCLNKTLEISKWEMLPGKPEPENDPYSSLWTPYDGFWKELYRQPPQSYVHKTPLSCGSNVSTDWPLCPIYDPLDDPPDVKISFAVVMGVVFSICLLCCAACPFTRRTHEDTCGECST